MCDSCCTLVGNTLEAWTSRWAIASGKDRAPFRSRGSDRTKTRGRQCSDRGWWVWIKWHWRGDNSGWEGLWWGVAVSICIWRRASSNKARTVGEETIAFVGVCFNCTYLHSYCDKWFYGCSDRVCYDLLDILWHVVTVDWYGSRWCRHLADDLSACTNFKVSSIFSEVEEMEICSRRTQMLWILLSLQWIVFVEENGFHHVYIYIYMKVLE